MLKPLPLIFALMVTLSINSPGQTIQPVDSTALIEKARYLAGEAEMLKIINQKMIYPFEALQARISGNVVFSVLISADGKMRRTDLVSSPDKLLTVSSLLSLSAVQGDWSPCRINSVPVDQKYLLVFSYRISSNGPPADYRTQVKRNMDKKKYDKVVKIYDREIRDNPFESRLFESRSQVKYLMGDTVGSKADLQKSMKLNNEIMGVVYVTAFGVMRTQQVGSAVISVPRKD